MSNVDFKKCQCRLSLSLISRNVTCRIKEIAMSNVTIIFSPCRVSLSSMLHVEFKRCSCRHVDFRGLGPQEGILWSLSRTNESLSFNDRVRAFDEGPPMSHVEFN